ncbi:MAG: hypothetical protein A2Y13_09270 [Planctomycetes bacterium GWC2_45_44]|nr:MAG: hypothetical protein A2Y13_09270 [Planctomycetes bacterium GWC2_45_44]HBR20154.1 hypothetical protein [Phycisphaerales bacterium]
MSKIFENRIFRCGQSNYYLKDEIFSVNQTHTDDNLMTIADSGFNGIWLRLTLRDIVPTSLFQKYNLNSNKYMKELDKLCHRADRFGLKIWPYLTEPLGMEASHSFWKANPDLAGHTTQIYDEEPQIALCSSTQAVQEHLRDGFSTLFKKLPLAGAILITSSEHVSNCWAHVLSNSKAYPNPEIFWARECRCPRCSKYSPAEVISSIITLIHDSIHSVNKNAKVVAWDWSWNMHFKPPYKEISELLPKDVILMGDFERGGKVKRMNKTNVVEEYSLVYHGPSPRFKSKAEYTLKQKRPLWARFQVNTTHELATVPNLPMIVSLYRKFKFLHQSRASGFMGCWNFACCTNTLNTFAVKELCGSKFDNNEKRCLAGLAKKYFGSQVDSDSVVKAWYGFDRACRYYPIGGNNNFLYFSPVNEALSYPLVLDFKGVPMGGSWLKHELGDRLEDTALTYSLEEIAELFGKLARTWSKALVAHERALASDSSNARMRQEFGVAKIIGGIFQSTHNIYKWYLNRKGKRTNKISPTERGIIVNELENIKTVLPFVEADSRAGFHEEAQWRMFDPAGIKRKIRILQNLQV